MMGGNDEGGLPKYVIGTLIFFATIAVWMGIALYIGAPMWTFIFIVVFGAVMAALAVWYLQPKEDKEYWK